MTSPDFWRRKSDPIKGTFITAERDADRTGVLPAQSPGTGEQSKSSNRLLNFDRLAAARHAPVLPALVVLCANRGEHHGPLAAPWLFGGVEVVVAGDRIGRQRGIRVAVQVPGQTAFIVASGLPCCRA